MKVLLLALAFLATSAYAAESKISVQGNFVLVKLKFHAEIAGCDSSHNLMVTRITTKGMRGTYVVDEDRKVTDEQIKNFMSKFTEMKSCPSITKAYENVQFIHFGASSSEDITVHYSYPWTLVDSSYEVLN